MAVYIHSRIQNSAYKSDSEDPKWRSENEAWMLISIPPKGIFLKPRRYLGTAFRIFTPSLATKRNCRMFVYFLARKLPKHIATHVRCKITMFSMIKTLSLFSSAWSSKTLTEFLKTSYKPNASLSLRLTA